MANEISLPSPNINPGVVGGSSGFAPNPLDSFIEAYFGAKKQASSESAQAREHEIQLAYLDLAKQKAKNEQSQIDALSAQHDAQGGAVQAFLKMLQPLGEASAQKAMASGQDPLGSLLGGQQQGSPLAMGLQNQQQGSQQPARATISPAAVSTPQSGASPVPNWAQITAGMSPSATAAFVEQDLPHLLALQKSTQEAATPFEQANTGGTQTVFDKKRGLYFDPVRGLPMSDPRAWTPSALRTETADQKAEAAARIALAREQAAAQATYRNTMENLGFARQFDNRMKTLRERAPILQQAAMSLNTAANAPNIHDRQVLGTTAVIQFLQAADQKGQLRSTLVQMASSGLDPSIQGSINKFIAGKFQGVLPTYILNAMQHHVNNLIGLTKKEYDAQYVGEMKRHPNALLTPSSDIFIQAPTVQSGNELPPPPPPESP